MEYLAYGLIGWNLIVFLLYGIDKYKAKKAKWRISEKTLLSVAFLMGGLGAFIGMRGFRHKTMHMKFQALVPLALALNVLLLVGIYQVFFVLNA